MTDRFAQADDANRLANLIRLGTVAEVQAGKPAKVRVEIEDGWISDFLPALQLGAGRVRTWSAPKVGEQIVLLAPSGELTAAIALRGLGYGEFQTTLDDELVTVLGEWDDGALDTYDETDSVRTIALPAGGALDVHVGGDILLHIAADQVSLKHGAAELRLQDGKILLIGDVRLGGDGGKAIARHDDAVVANKVVATSTQVKAV